MISVRLVMFVLAGGAMISLAIQAGISLSLTTSCCEGGYGAASAFNIPNTNPDIPQHLNNTIQCQESSSKAQSSVVISPTEDQEGEFPYRLTCPGQELKKRNYHLVLGHHIGMLRNWKAVLRDQLNTLQVCGLGSALDEWYISYSAKKMDNVEAEKQIQQILNEFPKLLQLVAHYKMFPSTGVPWEGTVMNTLRDHCQQQSQNGDGKPTVVFYWHTKGTSRWKPQWRQQMKEPYTYSRVLYWRKYMEYFLHERPAHCIERIVNRQAMACGVNRFPNRGVYGGNFWSASCQYMLQLPVLEIRSPNNEKSDSGYFDAEDVFGKFQNDTSSNSSKFVSLHQPRRGKDTGFYFRLIEPMEYASAISDCGPNV